ncbi:hypothetical protein VTL71DRAFT_15621 [Oculimacula yallundae]|uniref:Uncharacterized protein n=1 Tax=Oculimacula yallundae TaxID=86028 RepID=A0ABR4CHA5_9HELO
MDTPSFYTLSSGASSVTDDYPLTPSTPSTHDTSKSAFHIRDIGSFAESLQDAADQAFPNRGRSRYHTVNVCLIRWAEDELCIKPELDHLHDTFSQLYGFNTEIWLIPSTASQIQLTSMTCTFLQKFDDEGNLFIVYYGGHGTINNARQNQWRCNRRPDSPCVDWSAIQTLFGTARSDVLILLDCCAAASSASGMGSSTMEAIAACGWETRAPPPGQYSFTHTLIEVLEDWSSKPSFSAAMLHTEVLFVLKQKRPERGRDGRLLEWCATPVHWVYTGDPKARGIEISSLRRESPGLVGMSSGTVKLDGMAPGLGMRSTTWVDAMDLDDEDALVSPLTDVRPNGEYKVPHVLISIALEGDQGTLDAASCRRWLGDFPALVKYATVEGVYRSYSTLLTLSVPVTIWDLLPDHPACSFIGYITTPNKYKPLLRSGISSPYRGSFSLMYGRPMLGKARKPDGKLRSADSSYGSDGDAGESEGSGDEGGEEWVGNENRPYWQSMHPTRLHDISDHSEDGDGDDCALSDVPSPSLLSINTPSISSSDPGSHCPSSNIPSLNQIGPVPSTGSISLISSMLQDLESGSGAPSQPIDIERREKGQKNRMRYRSPEQVALCPRTMRKIMLSGDGMGEGRVWEQREGWDECGDVIRVGRAGPSEEGKAMGKRSRSV